MMDTHDAVIDLLKIVYPFSKWTDALPFLERAKSKLQRSWCLPTIACDAIGGDQNNVIPAITAIGCMHISIILIDDMLDADPRGEYHRIGEPATANMATAFQAAGLEAITKCDAAPKIKLEAMRSLNQMMLTTALGQYLDVKNPANEEDYWNLVRTKSSPFFGTALYIGALLGGSSLDISAQIREVGHIYGEMIQIHDDLGDTMAVPANPDWTLGRCPLPILYAQTVDHPEKADFIELRNMIQDPKILVQAQKIIVRCGAVSYCVHQIIQRYQKAMKILLELPLASKKPLEMMFEDVIRPVIGLFKELGIQNPEALLPRSEPVI